MTRTPPARARTWASRATLAATLLAGLALAAATPATPAGATAAATAPVTMTAAAAAATPAVPPRPVVSRSNIVRIARSQLNYKEGRNNCTKYGPCEEWCSLFATWVWRHAGVAIPKYAFTGDVYRWGQRHHLAYGRAALRTAKPGDVLLFGTGPSSTSTSTHIGIVISTGAGRVRLIEGNSNDRVRAVDHPLSASIFYGGVRP
jgi:cell wall-associated NlpC family hydrolase